MPKTKPTEGKGEPAAKRARKEPVGEDRDLEDDLAAGIGEDRDLEEDAEMVAALAAETQATKQRGLRQLSHIARREISAFQVNLEEVGIPGQLYRDPWECARLLLEKEFKTSVQPHGLVREPFNFRTTNFAF